MPANDPIGASRWERQPVRARYSLRVVEVLGSEGVSAPEVLEGTGLEERDLVGDATITQHQQRTIYSNAASLTQQRNLGRVLSERQAIGDHGVYGYAVQSSVNLAQALRILIEYQRVVGPLLTMYVEDDSEVARVGFREEFRLGRASRVAREEAVALALNHVILIAEPRPVPIGIYFDLEPGDDCWTSSLFGCPVHYGSEVTEIRLASADLGRELRFSDRETAVVCEERCKKVMRRLGSATDIVEDLRAILLGAPGRMPRIQHAARKLGMSDRTLKRRLREAGTTFKGVREELLQSLALDYLQESSLTIDEIALLLGYTETPNFHRAFKRWTGTTPQAYRVRASDASEAAAK